MKSVLITGANGFLGSHILELLIEKGYCPIILVRSTSNLWRINHLENHYIKFICDDHVSDIPKLFEQFPIELIIHTAVEYGRKAPLSEILQTNVVFPVHLIEEGIKKQLKLFVNTDTFFGKKKFKLSYLNSYTSSKRILEDILVTLSLNLKIANVRIEHVFGENDDEQKFVTSILKQAIQNKEGIALSKGSQKRDFIYVKDVANAYLKIIEYIKLAPGFEEFQAGTGRSISIQEFVKKIADITASKSVLNFGEIPTRSGEIMNSKANNKSLLNIGWAPQYDLDTALKILSTKERKRFANEI